MRRQAGQAGLEYLLLIGGAVLIAMLSIIVVIGGASQGTMLIDTGVGSYQSSLADAFDASVGGADGPSCQFLSEVSAGYPSAAQVFANVDYVGDGLPHHVLTAAYPTDISGPFPAMVLLHGGSWQLGSKDDVDIQSASFQFLKQGMAVFLVEYELSSSTNPSYPGNIQDVAAAICHIRTNAATYHVDPNRIGVYGSSAGGHLGSLVAAMSDGHSALGTACTTPPTSHRVQFVWNQAGPSDFVGIIAGNPIYGQTGPLPDMFGFTYNDNPGLYTEASVPTHLTSDDPPAVIGQGSADTITTVHWSQDLFDKYQAAGVESYYVEIPGAEHGFWAPAGPYDGYVGYENNLVRCVAEPLIKQTLNPSSVLVDASP